MLNPTQYAAVKNNIAANNDLSVNPLNSDGADAIANLYNLPAVPDFFVWKTEVLEDDITGKPSLDSTFWSWTAYINRSQGERDGWMRLFRGGKTNPSLPNVRQAFTDMFSGAGLGASQRLHINACLRRKATRLEKLLADTSGGNGASATPATLAFEGSVGYVEIESARTS